MPPSRAALHRRRHGARGTRCPASTRRSPGRSMNILVWHVHGSWLTAFVQGPHRYLIPVVADRGPEGRGRAETYVWPDSAVEVTAQEAADAQVDVVIMQ